MMGEELSLGLMIFFISQQAMHKIHHLRKIKIPSPEKFCASRTLENQHQATLLSTQMEMIECIPMVIEIRKEFAGVRTVRCGRQNTDPRVFNPEMTSSTEL